MHRNPLIALTLVLGLGAAVRGDVWDVGSANDNTSLGTQNELLHGSDQFHDLAAQGGQADADWYRIGQTPYASYEVVVDSTSSSLSPGLQLQRVQSDGVVLQDATPVTPTLGFSQSLRWRWSNVDGAPVTSELVRVQSTSCTTSCTANDVYRIRVYETTYSIPRFNNVGTQVTVLFIQNPSAYAVNGYIHFWRGDGEWFYSQGFGAPAKGMFVFNSATIPALQGQSGSVTVTHNGRYGALSGKAVSLEPATGYAFDTLIVPLPN